MAAAAKTLELIDGHDEPGIGSGNFRNEIALQQNTPGWKRVRRGPIRMRSGASEAEQACDCSSYGYAWDLCKNMRDWAHRGIAEPDIGSVVTESGHLQEDRVEAAMRRFNPMSPLDEYRAGNYFVHPTNPMFYGASPDGQIWSRITGCFQGFTEYKAPFHCIRGLLDGHVSQVEFQMACCPTALYVEYCQAFFQTKPETRNFSTRVQSAGERQWLKSIVICRIHRSEAYINEWMMPRMAAFSEAVARDDDTWMKPSVMAGTRPPRSRGTPMAERPYVRIDRVFEKTWPEAEMPFIPLP